MHILFAAWYLLAFVIGLAIGTWGGSWAVRRGVIEGIRKRGVKIMNSDLEIHGELRVCKPRVAFKMPDWRIRKGKKSG